MPAVANRLTVEVDPRHTWTRLVIDGEDVLLETLPDGVLDNPERLLGRDGLLVPQAEAREVYLAKAMCHHPGCGFLFVRVRREGDLVVWDSWRNTYDPDAVLGEFRFDSAPYEQTLERARQELGAS